MQGRVWVRKIKKSIVSGREKLQLEVEEERVEEKEKEQGKKRRKEEDVQRKSVEDVVNFNKYFKAI